jgi:hypothetical protein
MRHIQNPPPNLLRSSIPWHGIGSKGWVPRNYVQKVGALLIGSIYVVGAIACIASTFWFKAELTANLQSEVAVLVTDFFLVLVVLSGGAIVIVLGLRLLGGAFRPVRRS